MIAQSAINPKYYETNFFHKIVVFIEFIDFRLLDI